MSNNLILVLAIIIAFAVILLLIVRAFIKSEIIENNDFVEKFRELAKKDSFISDILKESGCDEDSLSLQDPKTLKNLTKYLRGIRIKKEAFLKLLDMPCIKYMDVDEIINRYSWCKGHKDCENCGKNKPIEFNLTNYGENEYPSCDIPINPYW